MADKRPKSVSVALPRIGAQKVPIDWISDSIGMGEVQTERIGQKIPVLVSCHADQLGCLICNTPESMVQARMIAALAAEVAALKQPAPPALRMLSQEGGP